MEAEKKNCVQSAGESATAGPSEKTPVPRPFRAAWAATSADGRDHLLSFAVERRMSARNRLPTEDDAAWRPRWPVAPLPHEAVKRPPASPSGGRAALARAGTASPARGPKRQMPACRAIVEPSNWV